MSIDLFGESVGSAVRTESAPAWLPNGRACTFTLGPRKAKGRGATPTTQGVIRCKKNPVDRTDLKLRFRRLATWSDVRVSTALTLLCEYFEQLAQFDIVTDERLRLWCRALQIPGEEDAGGDYTEVEIRHAILAKAVSLAPDRKLTWHDKLKKYGCPTPERFLDKVAYWKQRSTQAAGESAALAREHAQSAKRSAESQAFEQFPQALRARLESAWNRRGEYADALKDWHRPGLRGAALVNQKALARTIAWERLLALLNEHSAAPLLRDRVTEGLLLEFQLEELRR